MHIEKFQATVLSKCFYLVSSIFSNTLTTLLTTLFAYALLVDGFTIPSLLFTS